MTIDKKTIQNKIAADDKLNLSVKVSNMEKVQLSDRDKLNLLDRQVYYISVKLNGKNFNEKVGVSIKK